MAKIPTYRRQGSLAAMPSVRLSPQATPAAFGAQQAALLGQTGEVLQRTGMQLLAIEQQQRDKEDRNAAREALNSFRLEADAARSRFEQRRGNDAIGVDEDFHKELEQLRKGFSSKLRTPKSREYFDTTAGSYIPNYVDGMRQHRIRQAEVAKQATRQAEDELGLNEIRHKPFDTGQFLESIESRFQNLMAQLREQGITDPAAIQAAWNAEEARYHRTRVGSLLQTVTPENPAGVATAEAHMERFGERMDAGTREVLNEKIRLARMAVDAQAIVDSLMVDTGLSDSEKLKKVDEVQDIQGITMTKELREVTRQELVRAIQQREQVKHLHDDEQMTLANNELNKKVSNTGYPGLADLDAALAKVDISPEKEAGFKENWRAAIGRFQKGQQDLFQKGQYEKVRTMADLYPKAFLELDLYELQPLFKFSDWEKLVDLRNRIINNETDSPQDRTVRDVRKAVGSAVRSAFPVKKGEDATQEDVVAANLLQLQKQYEMMTFIEQRFEEDAARLAKVTSPVKRQQYVNNVLYDAFRKFNLDDGWWGVGDTEVFKFEKDQAVRALGKDVGEIVETEESREAFEKRTGVPADASRSPEGTISVRDRDAIEKVLRMQGMDWPVERDDGAELVEIIVHTGGRGEILRIDPNYVYPDLPRDRGEPPTPPPTLTQQLGEVATRKVESSLLRDPLIAWTLSEFYAKKPEE